MGILMLGVLSFRTARRPAFLAGPAVPAGKLSQGPSVVYVFDGGKVADSVFSNAYLSIPEG